MPEEKRRLAAIMFTDIAGYSALGQKDERLALELLEEHRRLLRPIFGRFDGDEIKTIGDAFLIEFRSAVEAVKCAVEVQTALHERNAARPPERRVLVRIGIHVGDIVFKEGDIFGDGVNVASRVQPLADPGGIRVTDQVFAQIRNKTDSPVVSLGPFRLKNIESPVEIFQVVLPWETPPPARPAAAAPEKKNTRARRWAVPAGVLVAAAAALWVFVIRPKGPAGGGASPGGFDSLAVLPLSNRSGDAEQDYFAEGMTEALITELSRIRALRVISRTSIIRFKDSKKPLTEIARELGVKAVVEGSTSLSGGRVHVEAKLFDAEKEQVLWTSESYDRDFKDVFVLQGEIARAIAGEIKIETTPDEQRRLSSSRETNPAAAEAYLKGRYSLNKFSGESVAAAIKFFQDATLLDPGHALAYAGLAEAYDVELGLGGTAPAEGWPRVKAAATRALELDDSVAEAHAILGDYYFIWEWNWTEADKAYRRAVELNPGYSIGQNWYGMFLLAMGRFKEALERVRLAKKLDPLSTQNVNLGLVYYHSGRHDEAIKEFKELLALEPDFAIGHLNLGKAYLEKGMFDLAFAEFAKASALEGSDPNNTNAAYACAVSGRPEKAREILATLLKRWESGGMPSDRIAMVYAGLGDKDKAFEWLDKALGERAYDMIMLKVEPRFRTLRSDVRFKALLRKMKF